MDPPPFTLLSNKGQSEIINFFFLTFQWLCLILYLYKQFLRLGQNLPLSYPLLFGKFWTSIFFLIDFRMLRFYVNFEILWNIWNFMKFLKELFPFCSPQWVVYRETIGLLPGKQLVISVWVNFHKTLKLFQVMWFNLSQWEVSEV